MDELLNEHEQGERVRSWLRSNALSIFGGIAIGIAAIGGYKWWQGKQLAEGKAQAQVFEQFQADLLSKPEEALQRYASLPKDTPYSALAGLGVAKAQVETGKAADAITTLRGLDSDDPGVAALIEQRLARLLVDEGKPAEALPLVRDAEDAGALDVLGDAQKALGKPDEARKAYQSALAKLEGNSLQRQVLEAKLAQLDSPPPASPKAAEQTETSTPANDTESASSTAEKAG